MGHKYPIVGIVPKHIPVVTLERRASRERENPQIMRTALFTVPLLFATTGALAQVPKPIITATPITTTTTAATVGQTITLAGTAYKVSTTKVLATGAEYYAVKATTTGATKYFLRTNNVYNATVFTQTQYETFLKTGKLSSFGTLARSVVGGRPIQIVTKGTVKAIFSTRSGEFKMFEFTGDLSTVLPLNDQGTADLAQCKATCKIVDEVCQEMYGKDDMDCTWAWLMCLDDCDKAAKKPGLGKVHVIRTTTPILRM